MSQLQIVNEEDSMPRGRPRKTVLMKSAEFIGWALGGLEREIAQTRERLASLTTQAAKLRARVGAAGARGRRMPVAVASFGERAVSGAPSNGRRRRRRKMSPEARRRISEMMKKRWAERRKKSARS
jgi:hypothetical protein